MKRKFVSAILFGTFSIAGVVLAQQAVDPTYLDVHYDAHERQVLDFYKADSESPVPLVIFIHGGGFQSFDKDRINQTFLKEFLASRISVASIKERTRKGAHLHRFGPLQNPSSKHGWILRWTGPVFAAFSSGLTTFLRLPPLASGC